jgi:hypothetical protein
MTLHTHFYLAFKDPVHDLARGVGFKNGLPSFDLMNVGRGHE